MNKTDSEFFIDFKDSKYGIGKVIVKNLLKNNETLKSQIKDVDEDHPNVLNIFIDTVSRGRFWRKLPLLDQTSWLRFTEWRTPSLDILDIRKTKRDIL